MVSEPWSDRDDPLKGPRTSIHGPWSGEDCSKMRFPNWTLSPRKHPAALAFFFRRICSFWIGSSQGIDEAISDGVRTFSRTNPWEQIGFREGSKKQSVSSLPPSLYFLFQIKHRVRNVKYTRDWHISCKPRPLLECLNPKDDSLLVFLGRNRYHEDPADDAASGFDEHYFRRRPKSFCMPSTGIPPPGVLARHPGMYGTQEQIHLSMGSLIDEHQYQMAPRGPLVREMLSIERWCY